jgi:hypothetical protein
MHDEQEETSGLIPGVNLTRLVLGFTILCTVFMAGFIVGSSADLGAPSANRFGIPLRIATTMTCPTNKHVFMARSTGWLRRWTTHTPRLFPRT